VTVLRHGPLRAGRVLLAFADNKGNAAGQLVTAKGGW
jgi:hypothetical protein